MSRSADQETSGVILRLLKEHRGSVRIRRLVKLLGLPSDSRRRVRRLLQNLVRDGKVISEGGGSYSIAAEPRELDGILVRRGRGWFLVESETEDEDPVRIPPDERGGALPGDRVRVMITRRRQLGSPDGRITQVLERGRLPVVGVFQRRPRTAIVEPDDLEICGPVTVDQGDLPDLEDGTVVAVQVDDPAPRARPRGRIVQVLGEPGELTTELRRVILEHDLQDKHPPEVEREVARQPGDPYADSREDLRHLPHLTIDPPDARDFDDAVLVERNDLGFRLLVSIADVAAFVPAGSETDKEALRRGCSVYFPGKVFPMLPAAFSEDSCTLAPGRDRPAVSVELQVDTAGNVTDQRIFRSTIRSAARLTYAEVQATLDGAPTDKTRALRDQLQAAADCARVMLERMNSRGALDLDLPEQEVNLDGAGRPSEVKPADRFFAHRIIEVFMIAANEAVGRTLESAGAPAVYRVHPPPDPEKMETFSRVAQALGAPPGFKSERPSPRQLSDYLRSLQGRNVQATISHLLLRSLMQARYSPNCDGHYGLASTCYLHFTSPIRRYPDLVVHRQLGALLEKSSDLPLGPGHASKVAQVCSQAERRALEAERAAQALYQAAYMLDYLGEDFEGTVSFVMDFGLFVRLHPTGIEGMVHISRMRDDYYVYHDDQLALVGRRTGKSFRVGKQVSVRVESVQLSRRQVDLVILDPR